MCWKGLPTVVPILSSETDEHKMLSCPATPFPAGFASFSPDHSGRDSVQESTHGCPGSFLSILTSLVANTAEATLHPDGATDASLYFQAQVDYLS